MTPIPQPIESYQTRILCMTSLLFYIPFLSALYLRYKACNVNCRNHKKITTVGQALGILSCITGTCSILYWHNQNHNSWRYYLDLCMAKTSGVVFFINGYMYIWVPYKRRIAYILCFSSICTYCLSNNWYSAGRSEWYIWHGLMHIFTITGQTWVIQCIL